MNTQLLALALDTPLEKLPGLPQAIRIVTPNRADLSGYSPRQLEGLLACVNGMIEAAIQNARSNSDDADVARDDERDLDWLSDAILSQDLMVPAGMTEVITQDYLRVLSVYKLGCAISESFQAERINLNESVVANLRRRDKINCTYSCALAVSEPVRFYCFEE